MLANQRGAKIIRLSLVFGEMQVADKNKRSARRADFFHQKELAAAGGARARSRNPAMRRLDGAVELQR